MSELSKASKGYISVEDMLYIEDTCWEFLTLLWRLEILKYNSSIDGDFDDDRYAHQRELVSMWYQLYMERKGS